MRPERYFVGAVLTGFAFGAGVGVELGTHVGDAIVGGMVGAVIGGVGFTFLFGAIHAAAAAAGRVA